MSIQNRERELHHFMKLAVDEQKAAIHRLADQRMGEYAIAAATMLSVEQVRQILGDRPH